VTSTAVSTPAPGRPVFRASIVARAIAFFSGSVGLAIKVILLALLNAMAVWAAAVLADHEKWPALAVLIVATIAVDVVFFVAKPGMVPLKFLAPGLVFLLGFQIAPILYTINVAFTNYSTGHILTKGQAIDAIKLNSLQPTQNGTTYALAPVRDASGNLVLVLQDQSNGKTYLGTKSGLEPIPKGDVILKTGAIVGLANQAGLKLVPQKQLFSIGQELSALKVPIGHDDFIAAQGFDTAVPLAPTLRYDPKRGQFVRLSDGTVFKDNGLGSFVAPKTQEELEPGWKTGVGVRNFRRVANDPLIYRPFLRVFLWTFSFAFLTVLFSFAIGLMIAMALDKPGMRFQRLYRSLLVIPFAIPGFLSLLVWNGLLNDSFGVVNGSIINPIFGTNIPWIFGSAWWARVSVIMVSVWLTVPYFFLVSLGALQSIPGELVEAARCDGGGPFQIFRRVRLPLLLVAVSPLLIASFAFNFNNFNNIYLLTGGGPPSNDNSVAGSTDILISYTWKLAFQAGKGNDYALASTIAILIFFIVAAISAFGFWRSKALETLR
jgi:arabinogalactan oligomer/maltooligosaccharide transport system permease protein